MQTCCCCCAAACAAVPVYHMYGHDVIHVILVQFASRRRWHRSRDREESLRCALNSGSVMQQTAVTTFIGVHTSVIIPVTHRFVLVLELEALFTHAMYTQYTAVYPLLTGRLTGMIRV